MKSQDFVNNTFWHDLLADGLARETRNPEVVGSKSPVLEPEGSIIFSQKKDLPLEHGLVFFHNQRLFYDGFISEEIRLWIKHTFLHKSTYYSISSWEYLFLNIRGCR